MEDFIFIINQKNKVILDTLNRVHKKEKKFMCNKCGKEFFDKVKFYFC